MKNMKKLSEVCKITGVTRRALQIYEDMDLLKPTAKTECGYWLYDDEAIGKIICIIIFKEAGYELKEIKKILNSPKFDFSIKANEVITKLEAKKKEITGFINYLKSINEIVLEMPKETLSALSEIDFTEIYQTKDFDKTFKETRFTMGDIGDIDIEENKSYFLLGCNLEIIGRLKTKSINDKSVQIVVEEAYKNAIQIIEQIAKDEGFGKIKENDLIEFAHDLIVEDVILEDDIKKKIETQCGEEAVDFIIQAVDFYYENLNLNKKM